MHRRTWEKVEQKVAEQLGGRRTVCSGVRKEGDIEHDKYYVEVKVRSRIPFWAEFQKVKTQARKHAKIPLVVFKEKSRHDEIVMLNLKDFIGLSMGLK